MSDNPENKQKVYALGETVLDMVSDGGFTLRAVPGGSVLNASVSLGRMGVEIHLISEFGGDKAGNLIDEFLKNNGVCSDFCIRHPENKTSLALAFLDKEMNASYSFYHDSPENIGETSIPDFKNEDILLFGSFYAVKPERRNFLLQILQRAAEAESLIYYDLNIRKAHADQFELLMTSFLDNISATSIAKGSDEDFMNLFGLSDPDKIYKKVSLYCENLIITSGSKPVRVFTPKYNCTYIVPEITPVSTIGAGDNFNAGIIYGLVTSGINKKNIAEMTIADLDRIIACGMAFASETCLSAENYIQRKFEPDFWMRYI